MAARALVILLALVLGGCRAEPAAPAPARPAIPLNERLGWVNGSCVAIMNKALAAETPVTVVALDGKPTIVTGKIVSPTTSSSVCPPLLEDRRRSNEMWSFYEVRLDGKADTGIAVTGDVTVVDGGLDLTGDGKPEQFTQCATSEGISFRVWSGTPYQGMPLWSGYYYLGYDIDANCPS